MLLEPCSNFHETSRLETREPSTLGVQIQQFKRFRKHTSLAIMSVPSTWRTFAFFAPLSRLLRVEYTTQNVTRNTNHSNRSVTTITAISPCSSAKDHGSASIQQMSWLSRTFTSNSDEAPLLCLNVDTITNLKHETPFRQLNHYISPSLQKTTSHSNYLYSTNHLFVAVS